MGLIDSFFKRKQNVKTHIDKEVPDKFLQLLKWKQYLNDIEGSSHFISRNEVESQIAQYSEAMKYFVMLDEDELLEDYCSKHGFDADDVQKLCQQYQDIAKIIDELNDKYIDSKLIEEKDYLDNILKEVDESISLDEDQRKVVISDEDYSLVIAGAGAGKTTTVAAKVKYLVEKQGINPEQILIISFTNKAVNELRDKINKGLNISCPIATFHSTGNAILHKNSSEQLNIVDGSKLYYCVQNYFRDKVLRDPSVVNSLILFFASK